MMMRRGLTKSRRSSRHGFVLIAVLWVVAALAALASIYATYVKATSAGVRIYDGRLKKEPLVTAALELTALRLLSAPEQMRPGFGEFGLALGDANVRVSFRSEASRIDLNAASKELLLALFSSVAGSSEEASRYAEAIIRWKAGALPGKAGAGEQQIPNSARKFRSVSQLNRVDGLPLMAANAVADYLTVYSGSPKIDIRIAPRELVSLLPGIDKQRLPAILGELNSGSPKAERLMSLLGRAQSFLTFDPPKIFRLHVRVRFNTGFESAAEVVIVLLEQGSEPFLILNWEDKEGLGHA